MVPISLKVFIVPNLGASIVSANALNEKGVKLDPLSVSPVLRKGKHAIPISTYVPWMYVHHIVSGAPEMKRIVFRTTVDAGAWHRRMGHSHPRALKQVAEKPTAEVKFKRIFEGGECEVSVVSKCRKSAHTTSDPPAPAHGMRSSTLTPVDDSLQSICIGEQASCTRYQETEGYA